MTKSRSEHLPSRLSCSTVCYVGRPHLRTPGLPGSSQADSERSIDSLMLSCQAQVYIGSALILIQARDYTQGCPHSPRFVLPWPLKLNDSLDNCNLHLHQWRQPCQRICDHTDSAMSLPCWKYLKHLHGVGRLLDCEGGGALLEDARLLCSNLWQRVAQYIHVVKA